MDECWHRRSVLLPISSIGALKILPLVVFPFSILLGAAAHAQEPSSTIQTVCPAAGCNETAQKHTRDIPPPDLRDKCIQDHTSKPPLKVDCEKEDKKS